MVAAQYDASKPRVWAVHSQRSFLIASGELSDLEPIMRQKQINVELIEDEDLEKCLSD